MEQLINIVRFYDSEWLVIISKQASYKQDGSVLRGRKPVAEWLKTAIDYD